MTQPTDLRLSNAEYKLLVQHKDPLNKVLNELKSTIELQLKDAKADLEPEAKKQVASDYDLAKSGFKELEEAFYENKQLIESALSDNDSSDTNEDDEKFEWELVVFGAIYQDLLEVATAPLSKITDIAKDTIQPISKNLAPKDKALLNSALYKIGALMQGQGDIESLLSTVQHNNEFPALQDNQLLDFMRLIIAHESKMFELAQQAPLKSSVLNELQTTFFNNHPELTTNSALLRKYLETNKAHYKAAPKPISRAAFNLMKVGSIITGAVIGYAVALGLSKLFLAALLTNPVILLLATFAGALAAAKWFDKKSDDLAVSNIDSKKQASKGSSATPRTTKPLTNEYTPNFRQSALKTLAAQHAQHADCEPEMSRPQGPAL